MTEPEVESTTEEERLPPLVTIGDPRLARPSPPVEPETIRGEEFKARLQTLAECMAAYFGIGIAAPQIGWFERVFLMTVEPPQPTDGPVAGADSGGEKEAGAEIRPRRYAKSEKAPEPEPYPQQEPAPETAQETASETAQETELELLAWINPEVVWQRDEHNWAWEGCLSVPGLRGWIKRPAAVTVRGLDAWGGKISREFTGWNARVFQHEFDHLEGILFPYRAADPRHVVSLESLEYRPDWPPDWPAPGARDTPMGAVMPEGETKAAK